jgi:hypothetical protein
MRILLNANDKPTRKKGSQEGGGEIKVTGPRRLPTAAWSLCTGNDAYAKKAELGVAEGRKGPLDQWV